MRKSSNEFNNTKSWIGRQNQRARNLELVSGAPSAIRLDVSLDFLKLDAGLVRQKTCREFEMQVSRIRSSQFIATLAICRLQQNSSPWWRRHWQRTGIVDIELADCMPNGWKLWVDWLRFIAPENQFEVRAIEADAGRHLTYNRVIARRRTRIRLDDPMESIPSNYASKPLLRRWNADAL